MKTRFLVSLLIIIPLAGTLVQCVPPPRATSLDNLTFRIVRKRLLDARIKESAKAFRAGDYARAAHISQLGYKDALAAHELTLAARFLGNLGGSRFALHQYQGALQAYIAARRLADSCGENRISANLELNISSIYSELKQMDAAVESARRAMARLSGDDPMGKVPSWLIHLAHLRVGQGRFPDAIALYRQGLAAADRAGELEAYASGMDDLGSDYLDQHNLPRAEQTLLAAYRVSKLNHLRSIEGTYRNLGLLKLQQGDSKLASRLLDLAVQRSLQPGGLDPAWEVYYARGTVRLAQNRLTDALDDLRTATRLAQIWRRGTLRDDATRVSTENVLQKVHSSLIEAGNRLYFEAGRRDLGRETFESAEANRAASLRPLLSTPRTWRAKLPTAYWNTLQDLETAEVELLRGGPAKPSMRLAAQEHIQQLRGTLTLWESQAGAQTDAEPEKPLDYTRRNLLPGAALFSFHLGSQHSYLWAVTRRHFEVYRLPSAPEIAALVNRFINEIRHRNPASTASGARLFRVLFGQVDPAILRQPRWLLALDSQLFEVPFAALIEDPSAGSPVFLVERHSLQVISGAGLLDSPTPDRAAVTSGHFLGIADPVYNTADPRWTGVQPETIRNIFAVVAAESGVDPLHLARLVGSAQEAEACAAAWGGSREPVLLQGESASRPRLQAELRRHPAVLHFATHVVHSDQDARSGLIVLSLNRAAQHQVVSPAEIAAWSLDGALVALSGCSSGSATALPGTGLMGLTRACQAAGAAAVVASHWSTPDDSGNLFLAFYRNLRAAPEAGAAAALQRAQIEMLNSNSWRSGPAYWSAYFVTGNRQ